MKKIINHLFAGLAVLYCISCSQSNWNELGVYKRETIKINPEKISGQLKKDRYNVDSICTLSLPDGIELHEISKFIVKDNKIFVMDSRLDKTIYVFDNSGKFLFKAGEKGRAKNEYIDGPSNFFVDNDGNMHVFDRNAKKILIFNNNGKIKKVIDFIQYFPNSFGMKASNKYILDFNFDKDQNNTVLAECDENNIITNELIHRVDKYYYDIEQTFFANEDRLSHIPLMADSVLVFKDDTLEKIVKFDFGGKFLMEEEPSLVLKLNKPENLTAYKGVRALLSYQETDNLVLLEYIYKKSVNYWMYNKKTSNCTSGPIIFDGLCPFVNYFLKGNQIISIITKNEVPTDGTGEEYDKDIYKRNYNNSPKQIQDIYDGKIKLPAIVFISTK